MEREVDIEIIEESDLMRVLGASSQFFDLLKASGVVSVKELSQCNAMNLVSRMGDVNREKQFAETAPGLTKVSKWIDRAKQLEPAIDC